VQVQQRLFDLAPAAVPGGIETGQFGGLLGFDDPVIHRVERLDNVSLAFERVGQIDRIRVQVRESFDQVRFPVARLAVRISSEFNELTAGPI